MTKQVGPKVTEPQMMAKLTLVAFTTTLLLLFSLAWSPRDFLTRRLAADLIARSAAFKLPQQFWLQTGVVSNKDYLSPEYIALQHHGWISASNAPCPANLAPPPCWDVALTPSGVETVRALIPAADAEKPAFNIPAARRDLVAVTGVAKQNNSADVEFLWKWTPLNEVGAAIYPADARFHSTVGFRSYDDGWRIIQTAPHFGQSLDEALKTADPSNN